MRFYFRLSWFLFRSSRTGTFNSSPQLLARGRAERGAWPGRICGWTRPPTLPSADVGRSTAVLVFVVRPAEESRVYYGGTSRWKLQATISTNSTNLAGVDRATGDEVKSSTAMRVLAQCKKEPRLVNSKRGRKCGQGQNRTADTKIFSPLAVPGLCVTIGRYVYLFKRLTALSAGRF